MDGYEYSGGALAVAPAKTHLVTTRQKHSALFEAKQADLGQVNRNHFGGFSLAIGLENQLLHSNAPAMDVMKKLTVTNETSGIDKTTTRKIESSTYVPRFLAAEVFGTGSEYFPFWQLPLWPFNWNRLFSQEEE